jgi:hypothetical protein
MGNDEQIVLGATYDPSGVNAANKGLESVEKTAKKSAEGMSKSFEQANVTLTSSQRSARQMQREL